MEINAKQLICNIILPLQLLAPLHFHCLFHSAFRDLASEQGEPGVKAQEGGEERTFWEIVSMELRRSHCVAALKEIISVPDVIQVGTQIFVEVTTLSLQNYSSSQ